MGSAENMSGQQTRPPTKLAQCSWTVLDAEGVAESNACAWLSVVVEALGGEYSAAAVDGHPQVGRACVAEHANH